MQKRLKRKNCVLVAIDYQEKLVPAMADKENLISTAAKLIKGFSILDLPIIVTQQYTKGLGETISEIKDAAQNAVYIEKQSFSAWDCDEFVEAFQKQNRKIAIVIGIEAHVCEQQTVLDLLEEGYTVYVAADCIGSRTENDRNYSIERMRQAGAVITTYESILFELMGSSRVAEFKQISALVK